MQCLIRILLGWLIFSSNLLWAQETDNALLLKVILSKYYANEKVIAKGRLQLLSFYCQKAPNNEELLELIAQHPLLHENAAEIKKQIQPQRKEDWSEAYKIIFEGQNQYLKSKVNNCQSFEDFQKVSEHHGENNQRLLIVSQPIYFAQGKYALVKVAFFRNIEHNSGSYLLFEKNNNLWSIKDYLNAWST